MTVYYICSVSLMSQHSFGESSIWLVWHTSLQVWGLVNILKKEFRKVHCQRSKHFNLQNHIHIYVVSFTFSRSLRLMFLVLMATSKTVYLKNLFINVVSLSTCKSRWFFLNCFSVLILCNFFFLYTAFFVSFTWFTFIILILIYCVFHYMILLTESG